MWVFSCLNIPQTPANAVDWVLIKAHLDFCNRLWTRTNYLDVVYNEGEKDITGTYANAPHSNVIVRDSDGEVVYDSSQIEPEAMFEIPDPSCPLLGPKFL